MMGFDGAFTEEKALLVGNPVRESVLSLPDKTISEVNEPLKILVVGGSLGAKVLNDLLPEVIEQFPAHMLDVIHQTGKGHFDQVKSGLSEQKFNC